MKIISHEQRQLLRAIVAEPREDTPRLVFADWLDENAHHHENWAGWARFIRAQISLTQVAPSMPPRPQRPHMQYRGRAVRNSSKMIEYRRLRAEYNDARQKITDRKEELARAEHVVIRNFLHAVESCRFEQGPVFNSTESWLRGFPWTMDTASYMWFTAPGWREASQLLPLLTVHFGDRRPFSGLYNRGSVWLLEGTGPTVGEWHARVGPPLPQSYDILLCSLPDRMFSLLPARAQSDNEYFRHFPTSVDATMALSDAALQDARQEAT